MNQIDIIMNNLIFRKAQKTEMKDIIQLLIAVFHDEQQIPIYRSNPLKTLTYQGFPASECSNLM